MSLIYLPAFSEVVDVSEMCGMQLAAFAARVVAAARARAYSVFFILVCIIYVVELVLVA